VEVEENMRTNSGQYEVANQPAAVSVGTSSTPVLPANRSRVYALFVNDSANVIYLGFGQNAVVGQGIRLNANGGSFEMSAGAGNLYQGAINAISGTANSNLCVTEGT
jgi:hypothetical protein